MFGWLAARSPSLCRRVPHTLVSRRMRPITPQALIDQLPSLGSVLYLHTAEAQSQREAVVPGVLVTQPAFVPLLEAHWLNAVSVVTDDGPREWCECMDRRGRIRARWHLLPDTDYLAWEGLTSSCTPDAGASIAAQAFRPERASVMHFRLRTLAGMRVLDQERAAPLSPLGDRIAARIAHAESVALQS